MSWLSALYRSKKIDTDEFIRIRKVIDAKFKIK